MDELSKYYLSEHVWQPLAKFLMFYLFALRNSLKIETSISGKFFVGLYVSIDM